MKPNLTPLCPVRIPSSRAALLAVLAAIAAVSPGAGSAEEARPDKVRERWERLPPEKRRELLRLHERLEALPPAERKQLLDRLRPMDPAGRREALRGARAAVETGALDRPDRNLRRELLRRLWESLPPGERERLRKLPPAERRRYLQEKLAARRLASLGKLPPDVRARIERLPLEEQAEAIRRWRAEETFRDTFRDPAELERMRQIRPPRRLADLLGVARGGNLTGAEKPEFLAAETWNRWLALKPFERTRALRHFARTQAPPRKP